MPAPTVPVATPDVDLAGVRVLVTRAAHQSGSLCELIRRHGGRPLPFPAIEIRGPEEPAAVRALLARLDRFDLAIFISPNAVTHTLALLEGREALERLRVAAVGKGTARALQQAGVDVDIVPAGRFDSEALLAAPGLQQVAGLEIVIFRGNGGRPLLGDVLRQRGATVTYAEVYRRGCPAAGARPAEVDIVIATSVEILDNLATLLGVQMLRDLPLLVISERMRRAAQRLGCRDIILAQGAGDHAIIKALGAWVAEEKPRVC